MIFGQNCKYCIPGFDKIAKCCSIYHFTCVDTFIRMYVCMYKWNICVTVAV